MNDTIKGKIEESIEKLEAELKELRLAVDEVNQNNSDAEIRLNMKITELTEKLEKVKQFKKNWGSV